MKNIYVFLLCSCLLVSHCRSFSKREMKVINLFSAIYNKDNKLIESILKQNVSINSIDELGVTPIFYSAYYGDIKTTAFLIRKGAAVDFVTAKGVTLLMRSIGLLERSLGAPLYYDEKIVKYLLDHGLKKMIHYKDDFGYTALLYACVFGTPNIVKWLLEAGADPNDTFESSGDIPFTKKIYSGLDLVKLNRRPGVRVHIKRLLIQYGAKE